jgi:hypothetical protein
MTQQSDLPGGFADQKKKEGDEGHPGQKKELGIVKG